MPPDAPEAMVEERRRLGIDKQDERWEGEWHFVNPPKLWHPRLNRDLFLVLAPIARSRGLEPFQEATGIFGDLEFDWRIPDQAYALPEHTIEEGLTGGLFVVELRSPGDESYRKLPFYAARGVVEALIVHEDRRFELFRLRDGSYGRVDDGRCEVLGVTFSTVEGPRLRVEWDDGSAEV